MRKHGKQKKRRWKKFHIGICPKRHKFVSAEVTELEVADCEVAPKLIKKASRSVKRVLGDGAYDTFECYRSAHERGCELLVPPRSGAVLKGGITGVHLWKHRSQDLKVFLALNFLVNTLITKMLSYRLKHMQ